MIKKVLKQAGAVRYHLNHVQLKEIKIVISLLCLNHHIIKAQQGYNILIVLASVVYMIVHHSSLFQY